MVGISLSPEQIRTAPPEVRRWLEREIAASLGLRTEAHPIEVAERPAVCTLQEVAAIYGAVRSMLPVANLLFELGRDGESMGDGNIVALRIGDMLRHTRLPGVEQLGLCLQVIDEALRHVRSDPAVTLCMIDRRGYCLVDATTRQNIQLLWQQMVMGGRQAEAPPEAVPAMAIPRETFVPSFPWSGPTVAVPNGAAVPSPDAATQS